MGRLDNYEQVDARLKRVHGLSDNIRFTTSVLNHNEDFSRCVIKAFMYEGDDLISTGIAMDWKDKDRNANRTNWVEVCETSAVGRAIANSKFQDPNAKRPSREEMEQSMDRGQEPVQQPDKANVEHPLIKLITEHKLTDKVVTQFFEKRGWVKQGQEWTEASSQKLDQVYERAKTNPEGFVGAIAA